MKWEEVAPGVRTAFEKWLAESAQTTLNRGLLHAFEAGWKARDENKSGGSELEEEKREHRVTLQYAKVDAHKLIRELQARFGKSETLDDIEISWEQGWRQRQDFVAEAIEAAREGHKPDSVNAAEPHSGRT